MNKSLVVTVLFVFSCVLLLRESYLTTTYAIQSFHQNRQQLKKSPIGYNSSDIESNKKMDSQPKQYNITQSPKNSQERPNPLQVNKTTSNPYVPKKVNGTYPKKLTNYEKMLLRKKELRDEFLQKLIRQQNEPVTNETKYAVFKPIEAGFGNSIAVLVDTIIFAYISNRHFYCISLNRSC